MSENNVSRQEAVETMEKTDPTKCPHVRINRVLDCWRCIECGAEFSLSIQNTEPSGDNDSKKL